VNANAAASSSCNLLNSSYGGTPLPHYTSVSHMLEEICGSPEFVNLYQSKGTSDFVVGYAIANGSYTAVYFTFEWALNCSNDAFGVTSSCAFQEYWVGNFSDNLVSGPYVLERPAQYDSSGAGLGGSTFDGDIGAVLVMMIGLAVITTVAALCVVDNTSSTRDQSAGKSSSRSYQAPSSSSCLAEEALTLDRVVEVSQGCFRDGRVAETSDALDDVFQTEGRL
jgi:hypothetical protein